MARRGTSGKSLVVGIDKPLGMTSHDVVDACRRIYGERRVGHAGTLDPAASGLLLVCVGPATRLNPYLTSQDKTYEFDVVFGTATDTDDLEGVVIHTAEVPPSVCDSAFAARTLSSFIGPSQQIPPAYSAIKVDGRKACDQARQGTIIELKPRSIVVESLECKSIEVRDDGAVVWTCVGLVSKGTYIRALARDIGHALGSYAHVGSLRRIAVNSGALSVDECASLDVVRENPEVSVVDPVRLMGNRVAFVDDKKKQVINGVALSCKDVTLYSYDEAQMAWTECSCTTGLHESTSQPVDGELVSMVADNTLVALYSFDASSGLLKSTCGFAVGVQRGGRI